MVSTYNARWSKPAERFIAGLSPEGRRALIRAVNNICLNPWIDNRTKISFPFPPAHFTLYHDSDFWILYHIVGNDELVIMNVGFALGSRRPHPFR